MHRGEAQAAGAEGEGPVAGLALMADLIGSLVSGDASEKTVSMICRRICELAAFRFCGVLVPDAGWGTYRLAGGHGFPSEYIESLHDLFLVHNDSEHLTSPTRQAADERRTIVNVDMLEVPQEVPWRAFASRFGYRSMVSVPLFINGEVIGVLNGYSSGRRDYTAAELTVVETLAAQAAVSLRISRLLESRQDTIRRLEASNEKLEQQRISLERGHEIHKQLTTAAVAGADAASVVQTLADLIRRPVAVLREDGTVRAISHSLDQPGGTRQLMEVLPSGGGPLDEDRLVAAGIRIPGERLGHVVVVRGNHAEADLDRRAVEHAATILALEAVKQQMVQATEDRLRTDFVIDLFRGRIEEDTDAVERARRHGLEPGVRYRVLLVRFQDGAVTDSPSRSVPKPALLRRELARTPGVLVIGGGTTLTAVVPVDKDGNVDGQSPQSWAEALVAAVDGKSTANNRGAEVIRAIGVGTPADGLSQVAASHADAEACLSFGEKMGGSRKVLVRDGLGILSLFIDTKDPEGLIANAHRILGSAIDHDRQKFRQLVATLSRYLDLGCDADRTAEAMFVHPNTVRYRIRQVESLCRLNLRDPQDLLQARIATLALGLLA
jgi:sugar diacid utilization regulator/GAF domain-containing protein